MRRRPCAFGAGTNTGMQPAKKRQSRVDGQVHPSVLLLMVLRSAGSPYETSTNRRACGLGLRRAHEALAVCGYAPTCGDWCRFRAAGRELGTRSTCGRPRVASGNALGGFAANPVAAGAHEITRFLFKKRDLGTKARAWTQGRLRRRGRDLGKRPHAPSRRTPPGREAPSARPRSAPFPSQTAILEHERKNMGAAPPAPGRGASRDRALPAARRRVRRAYPPGRTPPERGGALRGQNPPSL